MILFHTKCYFRVTRHGSQSRSSIKTDPRQLSLAVFIDPGQSEGNVRLHERTQYPSARAFFQNRRKVTGWGSHWSILYEVVYIKIYSYKRLCNNRKRERERERERNVESTREINLAKVSTTLANRLKINNHNTNTTLKDRIFERKAMHSSDSVRVWECVCAHVCRVVILLKPLEESS